MNSVSSAPKPEALIDRIWRGYDIRAMLPAFAIAVVISLVVLVERWVSSDLSLIAEDMGVVFLYVPLAILWAVLIGVALYRVITYTYRLTDRVLLIDRGFRWRPSPPIPLSQIAELIASRSFVGRISDVGWVTVKMKDGRKFELIGLRSPIQFASEIQAEMQRFASTQPVDC